MNFELSCIFEITIHDSTSKVYYDMFVVHFLNFIIMYVLVAISQRSCVVTNKRLELWNAS
jgi:surface polysaccharide O-acyltransferase-like enzyme